jgi:hypothetical protein
MRAMRPLTLVLLAVGSSSAAHADPKRLLQVTALDIRGCAGAGGGGPR